MRSIAIVEGRGAGIGSMRASLRPWLAGPLDLPWIRGPRLSGRYTGGDALLEGTGSQGGTIPSRTAFEKREHRPAL